MLIALGKMDNNKSVTAHSSRAELAFNNIWGPEFCGRNSLRVPNGKLLGVSIRGVSLPQMPKYFFHLGFLEICGFRVGATTYLA